MFWVGCIVGTLITCIGYLIINIVENRKKNKNKENKKGE